MHCTTLADNEMYPLTQDSARPYEQEMVSKIHSRDIALFSCGRFGFDWTREIWHSLSARISLFQVKRCQLRGGTDLWAAFCG